jgi:hypothetical protein
MSIQSRRGFLKTGALFGALTGIFGVKASVAGAIEPVPLSPVSGDPFKGPSANDTEQLRAVLGSSQGDLTDRVGGMAGCALGASTSCQQSLERHF